MSASLSVDALSKQLTNHDTQQQTLHAILQLNARGHDVAQVADRVVRNCLFASGDINPQVMSLSLDVLIASPSHAFWVDTLSILIENLRRSATPACLVVLLKLPSLPHAALQHFLLYSTTSLIQCLSKDTSPSIRHAAVHAIAALTLRTRPLTASSDDAVRLEAMDDSHIIVIRRAIERLLFALLETVFDKIDSVAVTALTLLTAYAHSIHTLADHAPINATKRATARTVWEILIASLPRFSERFAKVFASTSSLKSATTSGPSPQFRHVKHSTTAFAKLASHVLSQPIEQDNSLNPPDADLENAQARAIRWVETVLLPLSDHSNVELAASACTSLLLVCSFSMDSPSSEKIVSWGMRAVRNIIRLLSQDKKPMPSIVASGLVRDAAAALAALSKSELVTTKFIVTSSIELLPFAATCPGRQRRLETVSLISLTIVEYDLSGQDANAATALKAVLKSESWRSIMADSKSDSNVSSEVICCFALSLLESSKKISSCSDANLLSNLSHNWAVMLVYLMRGSVDCLNWPSSPASSFAKEMFIRLFSASGQYSSFLMLSKGIGMEEYESIQEMLAKAALEQEEVGVQASLLVCIAKYWLSSGLKAESYANVVVKAIWKLSQEHFRDEEIVLSQFKTGTWWSEESEAVTSAIETKSGVGVSSLATILGKRTKAALDTVHKLEPSTSIDGSTLITDYIYAGLHALVALVGHNPPLAEKGIVLLNKYMIVMEQAESADYIALEAVRNTIAVLETYESDFYPKPVAVRDLGLTTVQSESPQRTDGLAWLEGVSDICVFASSRLDDPTRNLATISTEEAVLLASEASKKKMVGFCKVTLEDPQNDLTRDVVEGDSQNLNGSADPFGVVASHYMDTVKGLALIRVDVSNRSKFRAKNVSLCCSSSGAIVPLPDAATSYVLGSMDEAVTVTQHITLAVRRNQGFGGKVYLSVRIKGENASTDRVEEEQCCIPYNIPSADVLLLRKPAAIAGVDVFRRRWDAMRRACSFHVVVRKDQTVDLMMDVLERKSKCVRLVGRMRTHSHVCALVADSSRGDYISMAAVAPEARGDAGGGPCVAYVTIRSNSDGYSSAFRDECRDWLEPMFRVIFVDQAVSDEDKYFALRPQDAYFITDVNAQMSPYQRWRQAHAVRMSL